MPQSGLRIVTDGTPRRPSTGAGFAREPAGQGGRGQPVEAADQGEQRQKVREPGQVHEGHRSVAGLVRVPR